MQPKSYAAKPHDCSLQRPPSIAMTLISYPKFYKVVTEDNSCLVPFQTTAEAMFIKLLGVL